MDEEVRKEEEEKEFAARREEQERKDREKTEKNRLKREKARLRKEKAKKGGKADGSKEGTPAADDQGKKKLVPNSNGIRAGADDEDGEHEGGEVKNTEEIGLVIEDDD